MVKDRMKENRDLKKINIIFKMSNKFRRSIKKTTEKAKEDLNRLSYGKATINQIRNEYGLEPVKEGHFLTTTKVKSCSYPE